MWLCFPVAAIFIFWPGVMQRLPDFGTWSYLLIPLVIWAPGFVAIIMVRRGLSRIKRAVKAANGRACMACLYDLSGQGHTGVCPECGRAFDAAADQRSWARVCPASIKTFDADADERSLDLNFPLATPLPMWQRVTSLAYVVASLPVRKSIASDGMPPVVKRLGWWYAGTSLYLPAAPIFVFWPGVQQRLLALGVWASILMTLAMIMPMFVASIMVRRGLSRINRAVKAANGRACVACLYDLSGQADTGVCPECGRAFDADVDHRTWARVLPFAGPAPMPPVAKRLMWWVGGTMLVTFAAVFILLWNITFDILMAWGLRALLLVLLAIMSPNLVVQIFVRLALNRIKRAVKAANGRACMACLYDLSGQADTGVCPECGRAFDADAYQRSWARYFRLTFRPGQAR